MSIEVIPASGRSGLAGALSMSLARRLRRAHVERSVAAVAWVRNRGCGGVGAAVEVALDLGGFAVNLKRDVCREEEAWTSDLELGCPVSQR